MGGNTSRYPEISEEMSEHLRNIAGGNEKFERIIRTVYRIMPSGFNQDGIPNAEVSSKIEQVIGLPIKLLDLIAIGPDFWRTDTGKTVESKVNDCFQHIIDVKRRGH